MLLTIVADTSIPYNSCICSFISRVDNPFAYNDIILSSIPETSLVFLGTILGSNSPFLSLGVSNSNAPNSLFKVFLVAPFL